METILKQNSKNNKQKTNYIEYLLITTLCSSVDLAIVTLRLSVKSSFAVGELDQLAIVWVVLA